MDSADSGLLHALSAAVFLLIVVYAAYVVLIVVPFLRRRPAPVGDAGRYDWQFLLPCLNEEAVIEETVRRLVAQFPAARVWCVDDASTDATPTILGRLAAELTRVHVVTRRPPEAQEGKGPALNAGWEAITRELPAGGDASRTIIGVVDADGRLDPGCLDVIAGPRYFGERSVGGVQIKVRVVNRSPANTGRRGLRHFGRLLVKLQDAEFNCVIAAQQTVRRRLGTAGLGGNGQFTRLSVLNRVAEHHNSPWHRSLIEDFELGIHILLDGQRTQYCHDTWVEQEGLTSVRALIRQRCRWGQGNMQCLRYLPMVLRSPHVSTPGALEIAYFLALPWLNIFGSSLFLVSAAAFTYFSVVSGPGGVAPLVVLLGCVPLLVWGPVYRATASRSLSWPQAIAFGLAHWPYTLITYAAAWRAFFRVIGSRDDWAKTQRLASTTAPPLESHREVRPRFSPAASETAAPLPDGSTPGTSEPRTSTTFKASTLIGLALIVASYGLVTSGAVRRLRSTAQ